MGHGPLSGIKVLDLTQFESGTVCTETLAWLGAEVLKVERPGRGELGRFTALDKEHDSYGFIIMNMNKKGLTCNMKTPEGLELMKKLVEKCDVIVENMGPGSMERLGLSYEDCKALNPKIIYASIKGFATGSPYQDYPAFDPIATHMGGFVAATGYPEMPVKSGVSVADSGTGIMTALTIIAALYQRDREGIGQQIECAMQDFMIGLGRSGWEPYYNTGKPPRRVGNGMPLEDVAPADTYPCKPFGPNDFVHVYTSRAPGSKQWDNLCHAIGREDLLSDPEMADPHTRFEHKDRLNAIIAEWTGQRTKQEAMDELAKADIPAGALLDIQDFIDDPQYAERNLVVEVEHPYRGKVKVVGFAPKMSENHIDYQCSPALGEHNEEIYGGLLGFTDAEIAELKEKKII